ncbi:unnamed protein product [Rangifer tarandus platyrhynchus]|uniref:Uncharacterized protein n=1 Tax=Rangifer tarandus platyrhynchus TaxID=3082113 RepID=A0AC59Y8W8_RANTA
MSASAERKRRFPRQRYWRTGRGRDEYFRVLRPAASLRRERESALAVRRYDAIPLPVGGNRASQESGRAAGANLQGRRLARFRSGGFRPRGRLPPPGSAGPEASQAGPDPGPHSGCPGGCRWPEVLAGVCVQHLLPIRLHCPGAQLMAAPTKPRLPIHTWERPVTQVHPSCQPPGSSSFFKEPASQAWWCGRCGPAGHPSAWTTSLLLTR